MSTVPRPLLRKARFVRQTGNGHFALVICAIEPSPSLELIGLEDQERLPVEFEQAFLDGFRESCQDITCQLSMLDGAHHLMDSRCSDFTRAAHLLSRELAEDLVESSESRPREPEVVSRFWGDRWVKCRTQIATALGNSLPTFHQDSESSLSARCNELDLKLQVRGDAPHQPAAVHLQLELSYQSRKLGQLLLSSYIGTPPWTWKLEDPEVVKNLLTAFSKEWIEQASSPSALWETRPPGLYWWNPLVEARIAILAEQRECAVEILRRAEKEFSEKPLRKKDHSEIVALLKNL